jgi:hypothetical protein
MKLWCYRCKQVVKRKAADYKRYATKRGYKSYCSVTLNNVYLKPLEEMNGRSKS